MIFFMLLKNLVVSAKKKNIIIDKTIKFVDDENVSLASHNTMWCVA